MPSLSSIKVVVTSSTDTSGIDKTSDSLNKFQATSEASTSKIQQLKDSFLPLASVTFAIGQGFDKLTGFMGDSVSSANKLQGAISGLSSVSKSYKVDVNAANKAAQDLASDGLLTVADSAEALKNLLASGFSLPESIKLLKGLKDQAAYNRQSFYDLGGAVKATTEGIKNGNSVLSDATGTTKNLSVIAKEAGISQDQMGSIAQSAGYRQAVLNGFLKETARSAGDAAKYSDSAAGKQAEMSAQTEILKQRIGTSLQPALLKLLEAITPIIEKFSQFTTDHPNLVAALFVIGTAVTGLALLLGTLGTAVSAIGPLFPIMATAGVSAFGTLTGSLTVFKAAMASPIAFPVIAIAAALVAFEAVQAKAEETRQVIANTQKAADDATKSNQEVIKRLNDLSKNGTADQKARAKSTLQKLAQNGSFATGGYTGAGGVNEVAGVVHKGEYVVPKSQVNQSTGLPKFNTTSTMTNIFNVYNQADVSKIPAMIGFKLAKA